MIEEKKEDKAAKKAAMKKEAEALGITYDELKKRHKRKRREAETLDSEEHKGEMKRLRSYSKEFDENDAKRRRTRSMDATEENEATTKAEKKLSPEEWRKEHTLTVLGHGANRDIKVPNPYIEFNDAPFSPKIQTSLTRAGFARPSIIQAQAWPLAVQGNDLISIAKTGSGKTCGFLMPVFHHHDKSGNGFQRGVRPKPILLVLAPTRELSVQIMEETQKFGRPIGVRSVCCYGGASKYPQIAALERGVECIIATPGRLNDLLEMRKADLSTIKYLVLDEADRMLDMVSKTLQFFPFRVEAHRFLTCFLIVLGIRTSNTFHHRQDSKSTTNNALLCHLAKRDPTARPRLSKGSCADQCWRGQCSRCKQGYQARDCHVQGR